MIKKGILYLIPTPLGDSNISDVLPEYNSLIINDLRYFIVEQIRTARRFLKKINRDFPIDDCLFFELNEHTTNQFNINPILDILQQGNSIGLMSEAGLPCIADPGNIIVQAVQTKHIIVKPLVGPSSLLLALMASGFCGQNFTFHGYLPTDKMALSSKIKNMEMQLFKFGTTQIFIETPYRNVQLFDCLLKNCNPNTLLCLATNITLEDENIISQTISNWQKSTIPNIHKKPTVFLLGK